MLVHPLVRAGLCIFFKQLRLELFKVPIHILILDFSPEYCNSKSLYKTEYQSSVIIKDKQ